MALPIFVPPFWETACNQRLGVMGVQLVPMPQLGGTGARTPHRISQVFVVSMSHPAFLPAQSCSLDHLQSSSHTLANKLWHTHLHPRFYFLGRLICDSLLECMLKMKKQKYILFKCQNIGKNRKRNKSYPASLFQ